MPPRVVLFVHGPREVGGDTTVLLHTLEHLDRTCIDAVVVATPDCDAWRRLVALQAGASFRLLPLDMGVTGTDTAGPNGGRARDVVVVALALARLIGIIRAQRIEVVY